MMVATACVAPQFGGAWRTCGRAGRTRMPSSTGIEVEAVSFGSDSAVFAATIAPPAPPVPLEVTPGVDDWARRPQPGPTPTMAEPSSYEREPRKSCREGREGREWRKRGRGPVVALPLGEGSRVRMGWGEGEDLGGIWAWRGVAISAGAGRVPAQAWRRRSARRHRTSCPPSQPPASSSEI